MNKETADKKLKTGGISSAAVKVILAVLFLLSAALTFAGFSGKNRLESSGFSSEGSFQYVYKLSGDVKDIYADMIAPSLNSLDKKEREAVDTISRQLLSDVTGEDSSANAEYSAHISEPVIIKTDNSKDITFFCCEYKYLQILLQLSLA